MLKALWFVVKIGIFVGAVLWVAERPGSVRLEWMDTVVNVQMGFFLACLLVVILFSIFVYRVIRTFVDFPASYRYYAQIKAKDKGYHALTRGLTAVAAGDTKAALREAKKARTLLPGDTGLPLLLEAQAARLDGREGDAQQSFAALLENKEAAFLGVRGLLQASLDAGDDEGALALARKALALHPKQPWILKTVYDLELRLRHWHDAGDILDRLVKAGAFGKDEAKYDKAAMALALAMEAEDEGLIDVADMQYKKARRIDGDFVPGVVLAAQYYLRRGHRGKAVSLIERAWKKSPSGAYVLVWGDLMPAAKAGDMLSRVRWFERLVALNPESADGHFVAGMVAMDCGLWGEARQHFAKAEDIEPSAKLYRALAVLEEKAAGNEEAARKWLEKAVDAPEDKAWVCRESGRIYEEWMAIAQPHGSFNTIEWAAPNHDVGRMVFIESRSRDIQNSVIDAPKVV